MSFFQHNSETLFQKLAAYYLNELPLEEAAAVKKWIKESDENARQYRAVEQLMQQGQPIVEELDIDVEAAWIKFNQKAGTVNSGTHGKVVKMKRSLLAAAVILGLLIGGWVLFQTSNVFSNEEWIAQSHFDTLQLPDGSWVIANGNATVQYKKDFNKDNREVRLDGNAFFKVHRDSSLPFSVAFKEGKVTVLGTQFHIDQQNTGFTVKVTEGKVKTELLHQNGEVVLGRGKLVGFNKETKSFSVESFATEDMLRYNNETLQTILKDILLAKGIVIRADESLASMKLTVDFTQSNTTDILQALELLTQARLTKTGNNQYDLTLN